MGSKTPPPGKPPEPNPREGDAVGLPHSGHLVARTTSLQRIADALQVSPTALYQPQSAIDAAESTGQTVDYSGREGECSALIHAFLRISDLEERRRILAIVQASAERG